DLDDRRDLAVGVSGYGQVALGAVQVHEPGQRLWNVRITPLGDDGRPALHEFRIADPDVERPPLALEWHLARSETAGIGGDQDLARGVIDQGNRDAVGF